MARQLSGRGPPVWTVFVAGALVTVLVGVLSLAGAETTLAAALPVLGFLFALLLFATALDRAGAIDHLARWLLGRARRSSDLPAVLFVGFGIASAFLVNDALAVLGVPVLLSVSRRLGKPARPLLLVLAFSVTVGSVLTPFGNPQNLLVALNSGIALPVVTFLRFLLLPTVASLVLGAFYLRKVFGPELASPAPEYAALRSEAPRLFPSGGWRQRLLRAPVLWVFPGTLLTIITWEVMAAFTHGPDVPAWQTALGGAVVLLLATPTRTGIVRRLNWEILLLFAGLFVVVGGAAHGGVFAALESHFPVPGPGEPRGGILAITGWSLLGSQLVSNVPWVALQLPLLKAAGYSAATPVAWMALAAGSTLAGNITLLGAASNLIVAELSEKAGVPLRLGTFVRYGLPLAALTVGLLLVALLLGV